MLHGTERCCEEEPRNYQILWSFGAMIEVMAEKYFVWNFAGIDTISTQKLTASEIVVCSSALNTKGLK